MLESWESFLDGFLGYFLLAFIVAYFNLAAIFGFEFSFVYNGRPEMTFQLLNAAHFQEQSMQKSLQAI